MLSPVVWLELCGAVAASVAAFLAMRLNGILSRDGRVALSALMLTSLATHVLDVAEWMGNEGADVLGDMLKVGTPAAWLIFVFVVTRDKLSGHVVAQAQQLKFFFSETPLAVVVVDNQQRYIECSRQWLELHGLTQVSPGTPLDATCGRKGPVWRDVCTHCQLSGIALQDETHFDAQGSESEAWFEWTVRPWFGNEHASGSILVVRDITTQVRERELADFKREQLLRSQKMEAIGEVAAGVAHDINNLLTVIGIHADVLDTTNHQDGEVLDSLESIRQAVVAASSMTHALLSFSKQQSVTRVPIDLAQVVLTSANLLRDTLDRSITLSTSMPDKPCWINGDSTTLQQLILNLAINARDAMRQGGGVLKIVVESVGTEHLLSVEDTGEGIPNELRARILEPFFTTKNEQGTGLGLAVVQRVILAHDARLSIDSTVGKGSRFLVAFPRGNVVADRKSGVSTLPRLDGLHNRSASARNEAIVVTTLRHGTTRGTVTATTHA